MRDRVLKPDQSVLAPPRLPAKGERSGGPVVRAAMDLQQRAGNRSVAELVAPPQERPGQTSPDAMSSAGRGSASADTGGGGAPAKGSAGAAQERSGPPLDAILLPALSAIHANAMDRMPKELGSRAAPGLMIQREPPRRRTSRARHLRPSRPTCRRFATADPCRRRPWASSSSPHPGVGSTPATTRWG
jgi:hypothetical protein